LRDWMKESSWKKGLSGVMCLMAVVLAITPGLGDETDLLIERALRLSGVKGQLDHLGKTILATIPSDSFPEPKGARGSIAALTAPAAKATLQAIVHQAVREDFNREQMDQVIAFYSSKVGTKVGRIADEALDPSVLENVREGRGVLAKLNESRRSTLEQILRSERVAEFNGHLVKTFVRGLREGYDRVRPLGEDQQNPQTGKQQILSDQISRNDRTQEVALVAYAYMFRSLPDEELSQLAVYCQSEAASWFRNAVLKGMDQAVYKTASEIGERLGPAGQPPPETSPGQMEKPGDAQ